MKKIFILLAVFYFLTYPVRASQLYFGAHSREVGVNQNFEIGVFLNTAGEAVNAVEGKIIFPEENIIVQETRDGGTIINFWIEKPHLQGPGQIGFSGIVPGGYVGGRGYLFSVIFKAQKEGAVILSTNSEKILLNDGQGTMTTVKEAPLSLRIISKPTAGGFLPPYDPDPPESFTPVITRDPNLFNNQYSLVFTTQDKGSGINQYEIEEVRSKKPKEKKWIIAESPYLLKDQKLRSYIFVKAIDKAGNERIVMLAPQHPLPRYKNYWVWIIIILVGLLLYQLVYKPLWLKRRNRE